jgi:transcriptional regulator with XRE-family HTH domain
MIADFAISKVSCQAFLCWQEMDMERGQIDHCPMGRSLKGKPKGPQKALSDQLEEESIPLFVGPWIQKMRFRPSEVARGTGINEGYLSQIISGKKGNPSRLVLHKIAKFIDIPMEYFNRPPPTTQFLTEVANYDPVVLQKIRERNQ